jgi:hypothetical protein
MPQKRTRNQNQAKKAKVNSANAIAIGDNSFASVTINYNSDQDDSNVVPSPGTTAVVTESELSELPQSQRLDSDGIAFQLITAEDIRKKKEKFRPEGSSKTFRTGVNHWNKYCKSYWGNNNVVTLTKVIHSLT